MSDIADEVGDILEESGEVTEILEEDLSEALGIGFDVSLRNVETNHHQGTAVSFHFKPDEEELEEALNEVSDDGYDDILFQNGGGVHMNLIIPDDD